MQMATSIHNLITNMGYTMHNGLKPKWIGLSHAQISGHNDENKGTKDKACMHNAML